MKGTELDVITLGKIYMSQWHPGDYC